MACIKEIKKAMAPSNKTTQKTLLKTPKIFFCSSSAASENLE